MSRTANPANRILRVCETCSAQFETYPSQPRKYCSRACMGTAHTERQMPVKPRTGHYQDCAVCNSPFWVIKSASGRRRFCSKQCRDVAQTKTPVVRSCAVCGVEMKMKPSQAVYRSSERVYCSRACMGIGSTKRPLNRTHNGKPARMDRDGYVWVWEPQNPASEKYKGWMAEHRYVAERIVGRPLTSADEVHHVNRMRHDNRPENLEVLDGVTHANITAVQRKSDKDLLAEYLKRFGPLNVAGD